MRLNFLEVCLSPDLGGLELFARDTFEFLKTKTSCKIAVAQGTKLENSVAPEDTFVLKRSKFFPLKPALKLAKYIDANSIDVVHFHWTKDIVTLVLAKLLSRKKPKLFQSRHMNMTRFKDDFYHRWLYKNIDTIHAVTYQLQEQLERFIPQDVRPEIVTLHLGVDELKIDAKKLQTLQQEYALEDKFIVGIVGRIEEAKGQYLLIEALTQLKDLAIKVVIVGAAMDANYLQKLQERVRQLSLEGRVVFTGFTPDVNEHIGLCDVCVLATKKETFGLVVIESMVNRVPVIATNQGGPLEIISDGEDGVFFDRSVDDLAEKIRLLYRERELCKKMGESAYKKVKEQFNKELQMQKLYEVLCS